MVSKTLLLEIIKKIMNNRSFYLRYKKYLKVSLFQCQGMVMILQVGIANTG